MSLRSPSPLFAGLIVGSCCFAASLRAQAADTAFFVTTQGRDTFALERHVRSGNTITGTWIQHSGGLFVHDYALVLAPDGWPSQYVMTLYTARPHTFLLSVTYGADSATRIVVRDSVATTERVAAQHGFPVGALSVLGVELALAQARQARMDSMSILLDRAEVRGPSLPLPVRFFGPDSVRIGSTIQGRVDQNGRLLALREGPRETRRVTNLPVNALLAGFVRADSIARAARVAVRLSPEQLQRFVGEYALNPNLVIGVTFDGDKLWLRIPNQGTRRLLPTTPTTFFMEEALGLTFEFETGADGKTAAVSLIQGDRRQRAIKAQP